MIKTEFLDDDFNEVDPEKAKRIIQLQYNDKGIITKRIEWVPKNKTGYPESTLSINKKIDFEYISKDLSKHYVPIVADLRKIIDINWQNFSKAVDVPTQQKVLDTLVEAYKVYIGSLDTTRWMIQEEKRKTEGRW